MTSRVRGGLPVKTVDLLMAIETPSRNDDSVLRGLDEAERRGEISPSTRVAIKYSMAAIKRLGFASFTRATLSSYRCAYRRMRVKWSNVHTLHNHITNCVAAIAHASPGYAVEKPLLYWRRKLRESSQLSKAAQRNNLLTARERDTMVSLEMLLASTCA
jgi:hypothetical protein